MRGPWGRDPARREEQAAELLRGQRGGGGSAHCPVSEGMGEFVAPAARADVRAAAVLILDLVPALRRAARVGPDPIAALADPPSGRIEPASYGGQVSTAQPVQGRYHSQTVSDGNDELTISDLCLGGGRQPSRMYPGYVRSDVIAVDYG